VATLLGARKAGQVLLAGGLAHRAERPAVRPAGAEAGRSEVIDLKRKIWRRRESKSGPEEGRTGGYRLVWCSVFPVRPPTNRLRPGELD